MNTAERIVELERQNEVLREALQEVIDCISETRGKDATDAVAKHTARYSRLLVCHRGCGLMAPCPDCGPTLNG